MNRYSMVVLGIIAIVISSPSSAMDLFSRANCGNNETITWDKSQTSYPEIAASSYHYWNGVEPERHNIDDYRHDDNAAKAIHWGEGMGWPGGPYWTVNGLHRWVDMFGGVNFGDSEATWCRGDSL